MRTKPDFRVTTLIAALTLFAGPVTGPARAHDLSTDDGRTAFAAQACAPEDTNDILGEVFFGDLSRYMEVHNRATEARRLDAIRLEQRASFAREKAAIVQSIAHQIKASLTDPQWFSKFALQMNGDSNALAFVSAARQVALAELRAAGKHFYEVNQAATADWTAQEVSPLNTDKMKHVSGFPGTLEAIMLSIPKNAFEFFVNNKPYQFFWYGPIGPSGSYINKQADQALNDSADSAIEAINGKNQFIGRYLKQSYFPTKRKPMTEPNAIEAAVWMAHLCISAQISGSSNLFSPDTINNVYIKNLKDRGSW